MIVTIYNAIIYLTKSVPSTVQVRYKFGTSSVFVRYKFVQKLTKNRSKSI